MILWKVGLGGGAKAVNQFLNAEKSIRLRFLIKFNQLTVKEIREVFAKNKNNRSDAKIKWHYLSIVFQMWRIFVKQIRDLFIT